MSVKTVHVQEDKTMHNIFPNYDNIIFFDVETSGLSPFNDQIIEFAAIRIRRNGQFDEINHLIKMKKNQLPAIIQELTGITPELLNKYGIKEVDASIKIFNWICDRQSGSTVLVSHNAHFDLQFLIMLFRRYGYPLPKSIDILDTLTVFRDRKPYPNKLYHAIRHYHITGVQNNHRALCDVWALAHVAQAMHKESPDLERYINLIGMYPNHPIPVDEQIKKLTYKVQQYLDPKNPSVPLYLKD